MAQAPEVARSTYRCIDCGQEFTGLGRDYWDHTAEHRPFAALCPDGYTRRFATQASADAATRGE